MNINAEETPEEDIHKEETALENTEEKAEDTAEETAEEVKKGPDFTSALYEAVSVVISAIMIIAAVFTFGFRLVGVNGESMIHTLEDGDWLLVTPYYGEPEYGDIVISTKKTAAEGSLVKRVIAVENDVVDVDRDGNYIVNGEKLNEPYIVPCHTVKGDLRYPITVPEGTVMLMGDNRPWSWDSRFTDIGFAEKDYLLGKARIRLGKNINIYSNFPG